MKKFVIYSLLLALLAVNTEAFAQAQPPQAAQVKTVHKRRAPRNGIFNGISGSVVAVGVGVAAGIAAIALIANNSADSFH